MENPASDLDTALAFVVRQVAEEAARSGAPLDDEERHLLTHLPTTSVFPEFVDGETPFFVPRDIQYEKLCALTKTARVRDLRTRPGAAREWEFAATVFKLNRHPMSWLLQWAGLKERRPWWDGWLLIGTALLVIACMMIVMLFPETRSASWTWIHWAAFSCGCVVILVCLYFVSRKFRDWQVKQTIERYRRDSP
jgi:hypothetical protein